MKRFLVKQGGFIEVILKMKRAVICDDHECGIKWGRVDETAAQPLVYGLNPALYLNRSSGSNKRSA